MSNPYNYSPHNGLLIVFLENWLLICSFYCYFRYLKSWCEVGNKSIVFTDRGEGYNNFRRFQILRRKQITLESA